MNKKNKKNYEKLKLILVGVLVFLIFMIYFFLGILFSVYHNIGNGTNILGQWLEMGEERFIRVRIDNNAIDYNITRIVNHEIGHEIWYRLYESQYPSDENEKFAKRCEIHLDKCVELYLNQTEK